MADVAAVQQYKLPSTVVRQCARVSNLKLNLQAGIDNFLITFYFYFIHCESAHLFSYANWRLLSSSFLIFMSFCLKIKLSINNETCLPQPQLATRYGCGLWWISRHDLLRSIVNPAIITKIYPMATITITITITYTSDNRRRCNAHAVAGDCWQCFDHHNYRSGHRYTHICGNICAEPAS